MTDFLTDSKIELDDLAYTYPRINDPAIIRKIASKEEFRELGSTNNESPPNRGDFFRHQKLIHRFMVSYNEIMLIHRTGTGKTCAAGGSSELFKRAFYSALGDYINGYMTTKRATIKKVYIITSDTVGDEFARQIVTKCSVPGDYLESALISSSGKRVKETRILKPFYSFMTLHKFLNTVKADLPRGEKFIERKYSNCMYILDEAHDLIPQLGPDGQLAEKKDGKDKRKKTDYDSLVNYFGIFKRIKRMVLTATPMKNSPNEIAWLMNLLLPKNQAMDITANYDEMTLEQLEPYFRGKISFIREAKTLISPIYEGESIRSDYQIGNVNYSSHQKIVFSEMAQDRLIGSTMVTGQATGYERVIGESVALLSSERQASIFMYPNGGVKKADFNQYLEEDKKNPGVYLFKPRTDIDFKSYLARDDTLNQSSAKLLRIYNSIMTKEGNTFIYSPFIETGAGIFGMILQARGWERLEPRKNVAYFGPDGKVLLNPTDSTTPGRYAIISSKNRSKHAMILKLFNSYENRNGAIIRVIILTRIGGQGLNLKNILQIHLLGPEWNAATMYQAVSHGLRSLSHDDLRRENPEKEIDVHIHLHASYMPGSLDELAQLDNRTEMIKYSSDYYLYEISEIKDIRIKRIERIMKQVAIDCLIHRQRNILPSIYNGTPQCDYDVCNYVCYSGDGPATLPKEIDYSSYDVLYSNDAVDDIINNLSIIYSTEFVMTIDSLIEHPLLVSYRSKLILMAIYKMVDQQIPVTNRFGYSSYLYESESVVYLLNDFPNDNVINRYSLSIYTSFINALYSHTLKEATRIERMGIENQIITSILNGEYTLETLNIEIEQLTNDGKISLFEQAVLARLQGRINPLIDEIYNRYENGNLFTDLEPVTGLNLIKNTSYKKLNTRDKINKFVLPIETIPNRERVYYHIFERTLQLQASNVGYNQKQKLNTVENPLRVYKPSENVGWRNPTREEQIVYGLLIRKQNEAKDADFEQRFDYLYGTIIEGKFKIVDNRNRQTVRGNRRATGKACTSFKVD
jgi:hypothetical protein